MRTRFHTIAVIILILAFGGFVSTQAPAQTKKTSSTQAKQGSKSSSSQAKGSKTTTKTSGSKTQQGKTIHLTGNQTIIWLKWPPKKAPWTLAHEAIHAMNMICETSGIKVSSTNDEIICYGVQHIMREVIET